MLAVIYKLFKYQISIFNSEYLFISIVLIIGLVFNGFVFYNTYIIRAEIFYCFLPALVLSYYDLIFLNQWNWTKNEYDFLNVFCNSWQLLLFVKNIITMINYSLGLIISWYSLYLFSVIDSEQLFFCLKTLWIVPTIMTFGNLSSSSGKNKYYEIRFWWFILITVLKINMITIHFLLITQIDLFLFVFIISLLIWWHSIKYCSSIRSKLILGS